MKKRYGLTSPSVGQTENDAETAILNNRLLVAAEIFKGLMSSAKEEVDLARYQLRHKDIVDEESAYSVCNAGETLFPVYDERSGDVYLQKVTIKRRRTAGKIAVVGNEETSRNELKGFFDGIQNVRNPVIQSLQKITKPLLERHNVVPINYGFDTIELELPKRARARWDFTLLKGNSYELALAFALVSMMIRIAPGKVICTGRVSADGALQGVKYCAEKVRYILRYYPGSIVVAPAANKKELSGKEGGKVLWADTLTEALQKSIVRQGKKGLTVSGDILPDMMTEWLALERYASLRETYILKLFTRRDKCFVDHRELNLVEALFPSGKAKLLVIDGPYPLFLIARLIERYTNKIPETAIAVSLNTKPVKKAVVVMEAKQHNGFTLGREVIFTTAT